MSCSSRGRLTPREPMKPSMSRVAGKWNERSDIWGIERIEPASFRLTSCRSNRNLEVRMALRLAKISCLASFLVVHRIRTHHCVKAGTTLVVSKPFTATWNVSDKDLEIVLLGPHRSQGEYNMENVQDKPYSAILASETLPSHHT